MSHMRKIGIPVFVLAAFTVVMVKPFTGLSAQGNGVIAITLVCLACWIFRTGTMPYFTGGALLMAGGLIMQIPLSVVMAGFTSSAVWVLIPALFFGYALMKTGLGKRIAYFVLKTFEPSYINICISWFIIGVVLSALTPSITVRIAIVMPIAMSIAKACQLADRSRGAALICFTAWGAALLPGTGWQTGSLWGIFMMGFYPTAEIKALVTPGVWFRYMAFPWFFITVLFLLLLYLFLKPKVPLQISREAFKVEYARLGSITKQEITCGVILTAALILFSTEQWTGIRTPEAALLAFAALMIFGIITLPDISTGVNWDTVVFFAVVMSLTAMFAQVGVSDWLQPIIAPGILSMAASPLIFLLGGTAMLWLIRFIDIPWGFITFALLAPVFVPLYQDYGLHPVIVSMVAIAAGNSFFLAYQQPFILIGDAITNSRGWTHGDVSLAGALYAFSVMVGLLFSYFYWKAMGLISA